jgi:PAS domain S-box-containing protein
LRSYVGLTDDDARLLAGLRPRAEPHFASIADEFYAVIRLHEGAFAILQDEAQARRLHASLQVWLGELLGGVYDGAFVERHARIGEVHVRVGLPLRYMVTAMSRVRVQLQRIATESLGEGEAVSATLQAIARICDLDLAIMLESYKDNLVQRIDGRRDREQESMRTRIDERERLFRDVLEAADVVVLGFDAQRHLVVANPKAERLTGYARDELTGAEDIFELLFGESAESARASFFGVVAGGPLELEMDLRTRAGKTRLVRWHTSAHDAVAGGDAPSVVAVGVDVTNERELERHARQNERLAAAGALAAGLAHEIRNPLNGASLHLSVLDRALARTPDLPPVAREAIDVLRLEIRRLGALVTDFLDVARPRPLARTDCDINEVASSVRALLVPEAESRKLTFDLERSPFPVMVNLDLERIKQVLVNLVRNAFEALAEGGRVVVRVRGLPRHAEIDVVDDGPGIPDATAPIFDAFYTTKDRGTGLGLSIVQRIVSDHAGDVSFASGPGATTFTVRIPRRPAQSVL